MNAIAAERFDDDHQDALLHCAWSVADVRGMERPLLEQGVPLMRMAAGATAHVAAQMLDDEGIALEDADIVLLAGAGDNGGDGLFAAATLVDEGAHVTCMRRDMPPSCEPAGGR